MLRISGGCGETEIIPVAQDISLTKGQSVTFTVDAEQLPFLEAGYVSAMSVSLYGVYRNSSDYSFNISLSPTRYYAIDGDSTFKHFSQRVFYEEYGAFSYLAPEGSSGIPIYDSKTGNHIGY